MQSGDPIKYCFNIAGISFSLETGFDLDISENFKQFLTDQTDRTDCHTIFHPVQNLQDSAGTIVAKDYDNEAVRDTDNQVSRYYHLPDRQEIYAKSSQVSFGQNYEIQYVPELFKAAKSLNQCFRMSGWEEMMICHDRLLLHASCIETEYGGILFAGPSGVGKSTQADLWIRYRNARLINGDRPILCREGSVWNAYGSPLAGSTWCNLNEHVPVQAIILLEQSTENKIRRLNVAESMRRVYALATVYSWDTEYVTRALNLVERLISEIPVYVLSCRIDEGAVCTVEAVLRKDGV